MIDQDTVQAYKELLQDLRANDRNKIVTLTELAKDNKDFADSVALAVEQHVISCPDNEKLYALYVLDSIVKNVREPYISAFQPHLNTVFCTAWDACESHQSSFKKLLRLWVENRIFPHDILKPLQDKVHTKATILPQHRQPPPPQHVTTIQYLTPTGPGTMPFAGNSFAPFAPPHASLYASRQPQAPFPHVSQMMPSSPLRSDPRMSAQHPIPPAVCQPPPGPVHAIASAQPFPRAPAPSSSVSIRPLSQPYLQRGYYSTAGASTMSSSEQYATYPQPVQPQMLRVAPPAAPFTAPAQPFASTSTDFATSVAAPAPPQPLSKPSTPPPQPTRPPPRQSADDDWMSAFMNIGKLLKGTSQSESSGASQVPNSTEFSPSMLKEYHQGVIRQLQELSEKFRAEHLQRQYIKKKQQRINPQRQRPWFVPVDQWLTVTTAATDAPTVELGDDDEKEMPEYREPRDEEQTECAISGEPFEEYYDKDTDTWYYRNATRLHGDEASAYGVPDGALVNAKCLVGPRIPASGAAGVSTSNGVSTPEADTGDAIMAEEAKEEGGKSPASGVKRSLEETQDPEAAAGDPALQQIIHPNGFPQAQPGAEARADFAQPSTAKKVKV